MGIEQNIGEGAGVNPEESTPAQVVELTPEQVVENYIAGLTQERSKAGETHRRHLENSPSRLEFGTGSIEVFEISMQIKGAVGLAQELGLLGRNKELSDFLE